MFIYLRSVHHGSWSSLVGAVIRRWTGRLEVVIQVGTKHTFLSSKKSREPLGLTKLSIQWSQGFCSRSKAAGA